jgi:N-acyl-phosphatidylethanolamine-hydrolysing phospholipase D
MASGDEALRRKIWKLALDWTTGRFPPDPRPGDLPLADPDLALPRATDGEARLTWVGHATSLVQLPGLNVLTDPQWSVRCSPVGFAGPERYVPAVPAMDDLPPIDAVLLSHDHYDHLDDATVRALHRRFGDAVTWFAPLGYEPWLRRRGVENVIGLDWWEEAPLPGGEYRAVAVPARHWTRRRPLGTNRRLWCGWVMTAAREGRGGPSVYFAGDSGYCPAFREIGERLGPFDASLLPIGAYDPRWFMAAAHMNPEEAVQAYLDVGGQGRFVAMHWGTWRLTFEHALEPPTRVRAAWVEAGLPPDLLSVLRHGETVRLGGQEAGPTGRPAQR